MTMTKQLINLLGGLVVIAVLALGIIVVAVPMFSQAGTTDNETRAVAQANDLYEIQVTSLRAEADRFDAITANLEMLRQQIAPAPQIDDAHELAVRAATATDAVVVSVIASEPVAWRERTADVAMGVEVAQPTPDDAGAPVEGEPQPLPEAGAEEAEVPPAAGPPEDEASPQLQVPLSITVEVADAAQGAAYLQALGAGPRLLSVESAELVQREEGAMTLIVDALTFVRTEN